MYSALVEPVNILYLGEYGKSIGVVQEGGARELDDMILSINNAITRKYHEIIKNENVFSEIENVFRQIRFEYPELAVYVKKQMMKMAEENGGLP